MSLLDDVSIVVTPNGYKAGELYAVIPSDGASDMDVTRATAATRVDENGLVNYAEIIGGEEIDNGKFTTNLDSWSTSSWWVWNSLGAYHPSTSLHKPLYQQCCVIGKTYLITFDLNCVGLSLAKFSLGSSTGSTTQTIDINLTTGSYSYFVTAAAEYIVFNRQNTAEYYVNNVSVKEAARDNVPRIDYTGGGCPHILAEPQRTNVIPDSQFFGSSQWIKKGTASVTDNTSVSPSGLTNACTLSDATDLLWNGNMLTAQKNVTSSTEYTFSIFVKNISSTTLEVGMRDATDGTVTSESVTLTNEWQRVDVTKTSGSSTSKLAGMIGSTDGDILIWGGQLEEGSYATSYIPTSGSTVTRNQDQFSRDGISSLINSTEGVLFAEMAAFEDDDDYRYLGLNDGTDDNRVVILYYLNNNRIRAVLSSGGVNFVDEYYTVSSLSDFHKIALKWKANDFSLWVNGVERATETSVTVPVGLSHLSFDKGGGTDIFRGKVKQLQVYKTALTDVQLAALTS